MDLIEDKSRREFGGAASGGSASGRSASGGPSSSRPHFNPANDDTNIRFLITSGWRTYIDGSAFKLIAYLKNGYYNLDADINYIENKIIHGHGCRFSDLHYNLHEVLDILDNLKRDAPRFKPAEGSLTSLFFKAIASKVGIGKFTFQDWALQYETRQHAVEYLGPVVDSDVAAFLVGSKGRTRYTGLSWKETLEQLKADIIAHNPDHTYYNNDRVFAAYS